MCSPGSTGYETVFSTFDGLSAFSFRLFDEYHIKLGPQLPEIIFINFQFNINRQFLYYFKYTLVLYTLYLSIINVNTPLIKYNPLSNDAMVIRFKTLIYSPSDCSSWWMLGEPLSELLIIISEIWNIFAITKVIFIQMDDKLIRVFC